MGIDAHMFTGALLIAAGVLLLGWGYRLVRVAMVVAGMLLGAGLGFEVCKAIGVTGWMTWLGVGLGALLLAVLMPLVRRAGMFLLGSSAGWTMAALLVPAPQEWTEYAIHAAAALVGGVAILMLERMLLIVATSYLGALVAVVGFGTLTRIGITAQQVAAADLGRPPEIPLGTAVAILATCLVGIAVQLGQARRKRRE